MACRHKFEKYLNLDYKMDFEPETLIVGTFNPEWPEGNYAEWFYGRTSNNYFWDLLPAMFGKEYLRNRMAGDGEWKAFCKTNKVAITDLIVELKDADPSKSYHRNILRTYSDTVLQTKFKSKIYNEITKLLDAKPSVKRVYFTTTNKLWDENFIEIEKHCINKKIYCQRLMTPSKGARFQMTKNSGVRLYDFILSDWKSKWHTTN